MSKKINELGLNELINLYNAVNTFHTNYTVRCREYIDRERYNEDYDRKELDKYVMKQHKFFDYMTKIYELVENKIDELFAKE